MGAFRSYSIGGRSATTGTTTNDAGAGFWNPSSDRVVRVYEIWGVNTLAQEGNYALIRITARGTASSTKTPTGTSQHEAGDPLTPDSGALLDVGYSVQPTLDGTTYLAVENLPGSKGAKFVWVFPDPINIAPGKGVAIVTPVGVAMPATDFTIFWRE